MPRYVALLQGINVGPKKRIAMAGLRALVESLGFTNVRTLVNSGNVVFDSDIERENADLAAEIEGAIRDQLDLDVPTVVRTGAEMRRIVENNPFPGIAVTPKLLHVSFLAQPPAPEWLAELATLERGDDDYRVIGSELYLHYPHGLSGATFLAKKPPKRLAVVSTSRNWNTVSKLAAMSDEPA